QRCGQDDERAGVGQSLADSRSHGDTSTIGVRSSSSARTPSVHTPADPGWAACRGTGDTNLRSFSRAQAALLASVVPRNASGATFALSRREKPAKAHDFLRALVVCKVGFTRLDASWNREFHHPRSGASPLRLTVPGI